MFHRDWRVSGASALAVGLIGLTGLVASAEAQTLPYNFTLSVEDAAMAERCAPPLGCARSTERPDTGVYVFSVHMLEDYGLMDMPVDGARFTLNWPEEWVVQDWWLCAGQLLAGDPAVPQSQLEVELDCVVSTAEEPFGALLQMTINCTVPGRFELMEWDPHLVDPSVRLCEDGPWGSAGEWVHFWDEYRVEIGEFCGRLVHPACDYCMRQHSPAVIFRDEPIDAQVFQGTSFVDTIDVLPTICSDNVYCVVIEYDDPCLHSMSGSEPWIEVRALDQDNRVLEVTLRTQELALGRYEGRLLAHPSGCWSCEPNCQPLTLTVLPPAPTQQSSWGAIKGRYR